MYISSGFQESDAECMALQMHLQHSNSKVGQYKIGSTSSLKWGTDSLCSVIITKSLWLTIVTACLPGGYKPGFQI